MPNKQVEAWFFPHPVLWIITAVMIMVEVVWITLGGFEIQADKYLPVALLAFAALAVGMASAKNHRHLAIFAFSLAFFIFFGKQARMLNYLSTTLAFPLIDLQLHQLDQMMGLDWKVFLGWINGYPDVVNFLWKIYKLLPIMTFITIIYLIVMRNYPRLREFYVIFSTTVLLTIAVSILIPAIGTFAYYNPGQEITTNIADVSGRFHLQHFLPLREGTMNVISLDYMVGLITFPSFHTTLALVLIWSVRRTLLFWFSLTVNGVMIAATPLHGGHYFTDLIGGAVVTGAAIVFYMSLFERERLIAVFSRRSDSPVPEAG